MRTSPTHRRDRVWRDGTLGGTEEATHRMAQNQRFPKEHPNTPHAEPDRPRPKADGRPDIARFEAWRRSAGLSLEEAARLWAGGRNQEEP